MQAPEVRYAEASGLDIAYAVYGSGPPDIVFVPGHMSHLDLNEEIPYYRPFLERLSALGRTTFFDRRGCGLSDRSRPAIPEEEVDDLRAVMDAAGIEQANLIGAVDGGPVAMLLAAGSPERVASLVLYGTAARLLRSEDYPIGPSADFYERLAEFYESVWGTGLVWRNIIADAPSNPRTDQLLARWERNSGTPRLMAEHMRLWTKWDVRAALDLIGCPTLVLYNRGDPVAPPEAAKYLAEHIPGATCVELPFDCHVNWDGSSMDAACDSIEAFLSDRQTSAPHIERVLATVVFSDVVGSTQRAMEMGDERWSRLVEHLESTAALISERFRGRVVKGTGDGILAVFDAPGRAITAATQLREAAERVGLSIRIGIHTGETELRGEDIAGVAVHLAARIEKEAGPGTILVSRTVTDLTVGSPRRFASRGDLHLKGFPQPWELFELLT